MKWELQVRPSPTAEGTPVTTYEGPLTFTKGTGEFEGIQGGGTIKGKYISRNISITEPEGEYWIEK
jgi:hypothetical protein